jgi:hypothetical protein
VTFAKLFDTSYGQVVVMLQSDDEGDPEIRFFAKPDNLNICSISFGYSVDEWDEAEQGFKKIDLEMAEAAVKELSTIIGI